MEDTTGSVRPCDDIAAPIYPYVDWSRCVVGGSHALQQYTRAHWPTAPVQDVDLACKVESAEELVQLTLDFIKQGAGGRIHSVNVGGPSQSYGGRSDERFDASIVATTEVLLPQVPVPIQFVGVRTPNRPLLAHLDLINGLPAAVTYTVRPNSGSRCFHLSDYARAAIASKRVPAFGISAERKEKYEKRGFEFTHWKKS